MNMSDVAAASTRSADERALIEFLGQRDVPCPLCGYNLRQLRSARCPECGRELELRVGLSEPRQGAWVTAQIAIAAAAGVGGLAIVATIMHGWPNVSRRQWLFNICFFYYMLAIPLAGMTYLLRRRFLRLERNAQWWIAIAASIATAFSIASMFLTD